MPAALHPSDFDERFGHKRQNAALDRALDKLIPKQPRFSVTRCVDGTLDAVWDKRSNTFTPIASVVAALFDAVGLGAT